jgi:5-methyltetrahydrofolate--homocysteine methyltransferase
VNSVNGEESSLQAVLPLVKDHGAAVIGLCMDDDGISTDPERRLAIAGRIMERAGRLGIPAEDILIDPLVMSVGTDNVAAVLTLETIERIHKTFGVNTTIGASNVSFGLPDRHTLTQAFLVLAIRAGATSVISDPMNFAGLLRATELLLAHDEYGLRYIAHFRAQARLQRELGEAAPSQAAR